MIIHCPSCRCEIKRKTKQEMNLHTANYYSFDTLTSNFDEIPIQILITCIRCESKFIILEWSEKN